MTQAAAQTTEQSIEYSIYVHHHPAAKKSPGWEMVGETTNMNEAVKKAEGLHASGEYHKVEIKQKYFDPKNNRKIDMTLKVLEHRAKKPISLATILIFALVCGGLAFGLTVYLVGQKPAQTAVSASAPTPVSPAGH